MVSSFHLTRSARLILAHPMNTDEHGLLDSALGRVKQASLKPTSFILRRRLR
jgi:hypothetical protein